MDSEHSPVDPGSMAFFEHGDYLRRVVGLPGIRVGRILGLGPSGKC